MLFYLYLEMINKRKLKKILSNLLLLVFSIVLFLFLGEMFSRIFIGDVIIKQSGDNGFYYNKPNQNGWYHINQNGWKSVKMEARINNIGARGEDVNVDFIKKNNKYVFLGDSFTFGWGLKDNETIPYYFKEFMNLDNSQVLNYAIEGYGVKHMIESYKHYDEFFNGGDVVIMTIMEHDFNRTMDPLGKTSFKYSLIEIRRDSSFISYLYEKKYSLIKIISGLRGKKEYDFDGPYFNEEKEKELIEFRNILNEKNQTLVIVFYEEEEHSKFSEDYSKRAKIFCEKNNIYCITNISSIIKKIDKKIGKYAVDGKHSSAYSNYKVAEEIANFIIENNLTLL